MTLFTIGIPHCLPLAKSTTSKSKAKLLWFSELSIMVRYTSLVQEVHTYRTINRSE
uniref:Uncharacterized protein n=1 Tax=Anguilla anguilla TaxID=7936 RepID=A0A0E9QYD2_ANGAN